MNGFENAQFDLIDATQSVETALDLLSSMSEDDQSLKHDGKLQDLINRLKTIRDELDHSCEHLGNIAH